MFCITTQLCQSAEVAEKSPKVSLVSVVKFFNLLILWYEHEFVNYFRSKKVRLQKRLQMTVLIRLQATCPQHKMLLNNAYFFIKMVCSYLYSF